MFIRIVKLTKPAGIPTFPAIPAVQALIEEYRSSKKLIDRKLIHQDYSTVDIWVWNSKEDFIEFYSHEVYVDFISVYTEYVDKYGIIVTQVVNEI